MHIPGERDAALDDVVREALRRYGHLAVDASSLDLHDDLYLVGLTSHATINVMIAVEDATGVHFDEDHLRRSTFASIAAISQAAAESAKAQ